MTLRKFQLLVAEALVDVDGVGEDPIRQQI